MIWSVQARRPLTAATHGLHCHGGCAGCGLPVITSADRFARHARPHCLPDSPSAAERARLKKMAYGHKTEHRQRVHAQVVLHAARGRANARIAWDTGLHLDTLRLWRDRFAEHGLPRLKGLQRCGRSASFTPLQAAEVKALACRLPAESGVPLSR